MIERRRAGGDGGMEALRVLKRRLSDVVYKRYEPTSTPAPNSPPLDRGARGRPRPVRWSGILLDSFPRKQLLERV